MGSIDNVGFTVPGELNAALEFGFTEVLFDLGLVDFYEVFTMTLCHPLELLPSRLIKKSLLLGTQDTNHSCISYNNTEGFIRCLLILPLNTNVAW